MPRIYMQLGDIKGDLNDLNHKQWIELESVEFNIEKNVSQESGSPKRNTGTPLFSKISAKKMMDSSTPDIFLNSISGNSIKCIIHFLENSNVFMEYILENTLISHYSVFASKKLYQPVEIIELSFASIKAIYTPYNSIGTKGTPLASGFDILGAKRI